MSKSIAPAQVAKLTDAELETISDSEDVYNEATLNEVEHEQERRAYDASDPSA